MQGKSALSLSDASFIMTATRHSRSARKAGLPGWTRRLVGPASGFCLGGAVACLLSGCGADYASSDPTFPGDFQARHPIALVSGPTSLDIYPIDGALDQRTIANLHAFAERYRRFGSGEILILNSSRHASEAKAVDQVRRILATAGLRSRIGWASYGELERTGAHIRVTFIGVKAEVGTACGLWPEDLASGSSLEGWKNEPYANFGCATQSVVAAQVDDPRDLVQSRALAPSDAVMRTRAIEDVRNGQDPGTHWSTNLTPIGESASGPAPGATGQ